MKSVTGGGGRTKKGGPAGDDEDGDDNDIGYQKYLYKAVGSERSAQFHANMTELYFELV